jgi:sugar phosphate isomerase/epimerase
VDREARNRYGVFGQLIDKPSPWTTGWWRYRIPGLGEVDWRRIVDALYEGGFDGVVSVEHEDPIWGGSPQKVRQGLEIAHRTLSPLIVS